MQVVLESKIIDKLSARGVLAYVALKRHGERDSVKLAALIHVKADVFAECLAALDAEVGGLQNLELKPAKKKAKKDAPFVLPDWVDREAWDGYVEMRQRTRHPLTSRARHLEVRKLEKLVAEGEDQVAVLDQSTMKCWRGLFPVDKEDRKDAKPRLRETEFKR